MNFQERIVSRCKLFWFGITAVAVLVLGLVNLDSTPPVWWDEGWTLLVARTWVEQGIYGRLLDGAPIPPILAATYPTTMLIALSFRLLGIGLWQARLVSVLFTFASLITLYFLVRSLYNRRLARATLFALFLMTMHPQAHAIVMGRQVLAEPPMLFFLLTGYSSLLLALRRSVWFLGLAVLLWGIALVTKAQVYPFWTVSLLVPFVILIFHRQWKPASMFALVWLGSVAVSQTVVIGIETLLKDQLPPASEVAIVTDLNAALGFVPVLANRLLALRTVLAFALPTLLGFAYLAFDYLRRWRSLGLSNDEIVRLSMFVFAGSWFAWYLLLANAGIPRYLYPPMFIGSVYVAILLCHLTDDFDVRATFLRATSIFRRINASSLRALLAIILVAIAVPFTLLVLAYFYIVNPNTSAQQVAAFINTATPS
ncbi:MAG: glycosyltransferase family 39 protein, partial [Anaerolineae bacterium]|nr:glycosyltransferase family 39 protein [Anaerolineae bacterium]